VLGTVGEVGRVAAGLVEGQPGRRQLDQVALWTGVFTLDRLAEHLGQ